MPKSDHLSSNPAFPFLSPGDTAAAHAALDRLGLLRDGDAVRSADRAGEGNMNLTLRVSLSRAAGHATTLILKQSRPWVEKYDFIDAPWDRAVMEARFYQLVRDLPAVASRMPRLLGVDETARVLAFQDLGPAADYFGVYRGEPLPTSVLAGLARYLRHLHDGTAGRADGTLANRDMRRLNHQHIHLLPLASPPPLDLDALAPGLSEAAAALRANPAYRTKVDAAAKRYLSDGHHLLHGDFFPGSWLKPAPPSDDAMVIDPEFCFFGDREFDVGVALAHLALARQPRAAADTFLSAYGPDALDPAQLAHVAGVEVMRRLIGLAQLPLAPDFPRVAALHRSQAAVLQDDWTKLW